jgi:hypothetical protein
MNVDPTVQQIIAETKRAIADAEKMIADDKRARKRAAVFRKLGFGLPIRPLIRIRRRLLERKWGDGPGLRERDHVALAVVDYWLDTFEMLTSFGTLGEFWKIRYGEYKDKPR